MFRITMDHSAMIFHDRHEAIERLVKLEQEGKLRLYNSQNLSRELASLSPTEEKVYHRLREMVFGKPQGDLNLADHGDLVLLVKHMKSGRDYFITMDSKKYASLKGHSKLDIRFPDEAFVSEVEGRLLGKAKGQKTSGRCKTSRTSRKRK